MSQFSDPLAIVSADYALPDGYDSWGIKSVGFDGRTRHGFRWPHPGEQTARFELLDHDESCPRQEGDGLSVATTWAGMTSGGYRAFCLLLVAYRSAEARGDEQGKFRVPQVAVVECMDGEALVRSGRFAGADLHGADLHGAHLDYADLSRANLHGADLYGADLYVAKLRGADLRGADLRGANLHGADLYGADLSRANLHGANLSRAHLRGANLHGADLSGAYMHDADLHGANLDGANLSHANLHGADLRGADLRGANLGDANLYGVDLSGAYMSGEKRIRLLDRIAVGCEAS